MIHGCVTLDEVFAAAGVRAASLVPETSGYLALAVGDATSRLPFAIDERLVMLTTEGNVGITKRGAILPPKQAAEGLRKILARLLAVSTGTAMPGLSSAARPREESDRGVEGVVEEIEAALIPVNRGAARRALARLARETIKAREQGRLKRPSTRPPPEPAAVAAPPPQPAPIVASPPPVATPAPPPQPIVVAAPPAPAPLPAPPVAAASVAVAPIVAIVSVAPPFLSPAVTPPPPYVELPEPIQRDPTPTVLGMGAVEIHEPEPQTTLDVVTEERDGAAGHEVVEPPQVLVASALNPRPEDHLPAEPEPEPTALPESTVLAQPTEDPALAFGLSGRVEAPTPLFPYGVEPRALPAIAPTVAPPRVVQVAEARAACAPNTRADDLLARFGASCVDEQGMREAAACLRQIAGLDPTPPPPTTVKVEIRPAPPPPPTAQPQSFSADWETPETPRTRKRRGAAGTTVALTLAVLVAGVAGGGAVVRYRPDLFGAIPRPPALAPAQAPGPIEKEAPPPAPPPTAPVPMEPTGVAAPSHGGSLGGTRAERASGPRSR
jgi:hypothetical protein